MQVDVEEIKIESVDEALARAAENIAVLDTIHEVPAASPQKMSFTH